MLQKWKEGHVRVTPRFGQGMQQVESGLISDGQGSFNAVYARVAASEGESGQSEEPLLTCARIRGTSLRSCIQCSQGLATACKWCSGLGRHHLVRSAFLLHHRWGACKAQGDGARAVRVQRQCQPEAREGGYSAVSVLRYTPCSFTPAIL